MDLTDQNFEKEVLKSDLPVLVDFFAQWCGPCKMQAPIIEELEKEYKGKVKTINICTKCLKSNKIKKVV